MAVLFVERAGEYVGDILAVFVSDHTLLCERRREHLRALLRSLLPDLQDSFRDPRLSGCVVLSLLPQIVLEGDAANHLVPRIEGAGPLLPVEPCAPALHLVVLVRFRFSIRTTIEDGRRLAQRPLRSKVAERAEHPPRLAPAPKLPCCGSHA